MPSTVIRRFEYDPEQRALRVEFVTGRVYLYLDVPRREVEAFRGAFAKGRHFNAKIRNNYAFRDVTAATD